MNKHQERRSRGLCYYCDEPAFSESTCCEYHAEKRRAYNRDRAKKCCPGCGGPKEVGGYCKSCWSIKIARRRERERERRMSGLCVACGAGCKTGFTNCDTCLAKQRVNRGARRVDRRNLGVCEQCGKNTAANGKRLCGGCFVRNVSGDHLGSADQSMVLVEVLNKQQGRCPYTGKNLVMGENLSLDYSTPKSRGGSLDSNNLQWVYAGDYDVNKMKGTMTDVEFKSAIEDIYLWLNSSKEQNGLCKE